MFPDVSASNNQTEIETNHNNSNKMGEVDTIYEKEDSLRDSHTFRPSYNPLRSTCLRISRPETKSGDVITKFYSSIDDFLQENGIIADYVHNYDRTWRAQGIDLKIPNEELVELLEKVAVKKSTMYDNWANTNSVTYSVPSNYEVVTVQECSGAVKQRFSLVDGKLYDRDLIYRYSALSHSWVPICSNKIPLPVFRTSNSRVDKNIVPLKILSVSNQLKSGRYNNPTTGILHHDCSWQYGNSRGVAGNVEIDLGTPQIVTHIGTVGSFIPTELYPTIEQQFNSRGNGRRKRYRRKYNQGIYVESDQSTQSWCSYRLMAKKAASDHWMYVGNYTANHNSYELVVNEVSSNLLGVPVRYLMLKPVSNLHKHDWNQLTPCRMSIAVYGKVIEAKKKPSIAAGVNAGSSKGGVNDGGEVQNVELIEYTLTVPPVKQVRVKQNQHSYHWEYDDRTKWSTKKPFFDKIRDDLKERGSGDADCFDVCEYTEGESDEDEEKEDGFECDNNDVFEYKDYDATRVFDESEWPSLQSATVSVSRSRSIDVSDANEGSSVTSDDAETCVSSSASQENDWELI